jgi:hypothetical protein
MLGGRRQAAGTAGRQAATGGTWVLTPAGNRDLSRCRAARVSLGSCSGAPVSTATSTCWVNAGAVSARAGECS